MEPFLIKRELNLSQEIEEIVNIDNHMSIDEKPSSIKLEYIDNNTSSTPICSGNYFEIKQELNCSYEDYPIHEVKNDDLEEIVNIDNHSLIDKKPNNIKLEYIDNNTTSIPSIRICSGKYSELKQELNYSPEDHLLHNVDKASSDHSLSKLSNAIILLERLSTVQILKYTKKTETDSEYTYRLNVDAMKYVCVYSCSKCDGTIDIKSIRHIINRPQCGCTPTLAYQCMSCNKHFISYGGIQKHVNTTGFCRSRKRFLDLAEFDDNEWEKLNCPKCNVSLENIAKFTKHVNDCGEVPKFWCSCCDFGSINISSFQAHFKLHASRQSKKSESDCSAERFPLLKTTICYCSTCDETLVKKGFRNPSSTCNKCGTPYTYRCPKCNKEYSRRTNAECHLNSTCNIFNDYRCSVCKEKKFAGPAQLRRHLSHCGRTLYLNCKFCPYKTKHIENFRRHSKRHFEKDCSFIDQDRDVGPLYELFCEQCSEPKENGECGDYFYYCLKCKTKLWLQCRKCNVEYRSRRSMMDHITSNCGLNDKLQKCPKCERQFKVLNLHIGACRDLNKYCAHCPYKTKIRQCLSRHLFCKHRDEF